MTQVVWILRLNMLQRFVRLVRIRGVKLRSRRFDRLLVIHLSLRLGRPGNVVLCRDRVVTATRASRSRLQCRPREGGRYRWRWWRAVALSMGRSLTDLVRLMTSLRTAGPRL